MILLTKKKWTNWILCTGLRPNGRIRYPGFVWHECSTHFQVTLKLLLQLVTFIVKQTFTKLLYDYYYYYYHSLLFRVIDWISRLIKVRKLSLHCYMSSVNGRKLKTAVYSELILIHNTAHNRLFTSENLAWKNIFRKTFSSIDRL